MDEAKKTIHCNKCKKDFQFEMRALASLGHCPECRAPRYEMSLIGALGGASAQSQAADSRAPFPWENAQPKPAAAAQGSRPEPTSAAPRPTGVVIGALVLALLVGGGVLAWWLCKGDGRDEFRTAVAQGMASDVLHTGIFQHFRHPDAYREAYDVPDIAAMSADERGAWFDAHLTEDRVVFFWEVCDMRNAILDEGSSFSTREFWIALDQDQQTELLALAFRCERGRKIVDSAEKYADALRDYRPGLTPAASETMLEMDLASIEATRTGIDRMIEITEPGGDTMILEFKGNSDLADEVWAELKSTRVEAFNRNKDRCTKEAAGNPESEASLKWLEGIADSVEATFLSVRVEFEAKKGVDGWKVTRTRRYDRQRDVWEDWKLTPKNPDRILGLSYTGKLADDKPPTFELLKQQLEAELKQHRETFVSMKLKP